MVFPEFVAGIMTFVMIALLICNNSFIGRLTTDGVARETWLSLCVRVW